MQINLATQNLQTNTNFQSAYRVHGVYLNGEYFGNKRKDTIYRVANALTCGMFKKTLPKEIKTLIQKFFPDFKDHPFAMLARTPEPRYLQKINILTSIDAQEYKNTLDILSTSNDTEERKEVLLGTLEHILKKNNNKQIIITAEENNGNITITNIEHAQKSQSPQRYK